VRIKVLIALSLIPLLLSTVIGYSETQQCDPLLKFLLAPGGNGWETGGDLTSIRPHTLSLPAAGEQLYRGGISITGTYSDYYRVGGLENRKASFGRSAHSAAFLTGNQPFVWELRSRSTQHLWRISALNEQYDQVMTAGCDYLTTTLEGKAVFDPVIFSTGITVSPQHPPDPCFAAWVDFERFGAIGFQWRRQHVKVDADLNKSNDLNHLVLFGLREGMVGWMKSPEAGPISAELILQQDKWVRYSTGNCMPTLEPWGEQIGYHGFLTLDAGNWKGRLGLRGQEFDLMAYGVMEPFNYAKITAFRLDINSFFAAVEHYSSDREERLLTEIEWLEWEGYGRGHVEFWPFTTGLIDLLGLRRYFIAMTSGHLYRLHVGGRRRLTDSFSFAGGFNLMDVYPEAEVRHWRPAFLVFGVADEQHHELDIRRILAGMIHLSVKYRYASGTVGYSFAQGIPIKVWRREVVVEEPPPVVEPVEKAKGYGGGFHRIDFEWVF